MDDTILELLKEFVSVTIIPWGIMWVLAFIWQWVWFLWYPPSVRDLVMDELENSGGGKRNPLYQIEVPGYIRFLVGLPPNQGEIVLWAAKVQLCSVICAVFNWLFLRNSEIHSSGMQIKARGYAFLLFFLMMILLQRLLVYRFFNKSPRTGPVFKSIRLSDRRIPTNTLVMLVLGIAMVILLLSFGMVKVLGEEYATLARVMMSLGSFIFGLIGFVYILRQEYSLSSTHYLRGQRAIKSGLVIVAIGWGVAILNLILLFFYNGR